MTLRRLLPAIALALVWLAAAAEPGVLYAADGGQAALPAAPAEYARWNRELPPADLARGRTLFVANCSVCHGMGADGRGPAAVGLNPPPADLTDPARLAALDNAFLFYRITEGKLGTAMPAFGPVLSEQDRAALIRYLRALPARTSKPADEPARAPDAGE